MKLNLLSFGLLTLLVPLTSHGEILPRPAQWKLEVNCDMREMDSATGQELLYTLSAPIVDPQTPEKPETYDIAGVTLMPGHKSAGINFDLRMFPTVSIRAHLAIDVRNLSTKSVDTSKAAFKYLINVYDGPKNQVFTSDDLEFTGLKYRSFSVTYDIEGRKFVQVSCKPHTLNPS